MTRTLITILVVMHATMVMADDAALEYSDIIRAEVIGSDDSTLQVGLAVYNSIPLAGMEIPLSFTASAGTVTLKEIEFGDRVASWDVKNAAIDNNAHTLLIIMISEMGRSRPSPQLPVATDVDANVAVLHFTRSGGGVPIFEVATFTRGASHGLWCHHNDYSKGYPDVVTFVPKFESQVLAKPAIPNAFELHQNYPNPFNGMTRIDYSVPLASAIDLEITNILGQRVRLLRGETVEAGNYSILWNATNDQGTGVASGMYFVVLRVGAFSTQRKMSYLK